MYTTEMKIRNLMTNYVSQKLDMSHLSDIIEDTSKYIDDIIKQTVTLPFIKTPKIIEKICNRLVIYELYAMQTIDDCPQVVIDNYNWAEAKLEQIANGNIILDEQEKTMEIRWIAKEKFFE